MNIPVRNIFKKEAYIGISPLLILGSIIIGWDYSVLVLGVLFKYLLLPGNSTLLVSGLFFITLMTALGFFFVRTKHPLVFDRFMRHTLVISGFGLVFHVLPAEKIIEIQYSDYPDYAKARTELYYNPTDSSIIKRESIEFNKMQESKTNQEN